MPTVHALGCGRIVAQYQSFGRDAAMVFSFRTPTLQVPSPVDCFDACAGFLEWDATGLMGGFRRFRSANSVLLGVRAFTVDPRGGGAAYGVPSDGRGFIDSPEVGELPTSVAPLVQWQTRERGKRSGRTYVVGCTTALNNLLGDAETIPELNTFALAAQFDDLRASLSVGGGLVQVVLSRKLSITTGSLHVPLDITGCEVSTLMASQRRRTRPSTSA